MCHATILINWNGDMGFSKVREFRVARAPLPLLGTFRAYVAGGEWIASQALPWRARLSRLALHNDGIRLRRASVLTAIEIHKTLPVSFAILELPRPNLPDSLRWAWITHVWTQERWRGHGAATLLVNEACRVARAAKSRGVTLESARFKTRHNLYERVGFHRETSPTEFIMRKEFRRGDPRKTTAVVWPVQVDDLAAAGTLLSTEHFVSAHRQVWRLEKGFAPEESFCELIRGEKDLGLMGSYSSKKADVLFWQRSDLRVMRIGTWTEQPKTVWQLAESTMKSAPEIDGDIEYYSPRFAY